MAGGDSARASSGGPSRSRAARRLLALGLAAAVLGASWPAAAQPVRARPLRALDPPTMSPVAAPVPTNGSAAASISAAAPAPGVSLLDLRSHVLAFGPVASDEAAEQPAAIVARVVSEGPWFLWLTCGGLLVEGHGRVLPASRLAWRGADGGEFRRLPTGSPVLVARGAATGPAGEPVSIDLRLQVHDEDPMGGLRADLRLELAN